MKQEYKIKLRNFFIGFFGWLLIGNIYLTAFLTFPPVDFRKKYFLESGIGEYLFGIVTLIVICILFMRKKNWIVYGNLTVCIANTIAWAIFEGLDHPLDILIIGLSVPLPAGILIILSMLQ